MPKTIAVDLSTFKPCRYSTNDPVTAIRRDINDELESWISILRGPHKGSRGRVIRIKDRPPTDYSSERGVFIYVELEKGAKPVSVVHECSWNPSAIKTTDNTYFKFNSKSGVKVKLIDKYGQEITKDSVIIVCRQSEIFACSVASITTTGGINLVSYEGRKFLNSSDSFEDRDGVLFKFHNNLMVMGPDTRDALIKFRLSQ